MAKHILVIEDEEPLQLILKDKLSAAGFEIIQARNGQEGVEAALRDKPNLILLDLQMPVMEGNTALKKIREEGGDYGAHVPVIALTNLNDSTNITGSMENKITHYWVKSDWNIDELVKAIKEKLEVMERVYPDYTKASTS